MDNAIVQPAQDDMQQDQQVQPAPAKEKKRLNITRFINSPWIFLVVPVLAGAIWLVNNTWIITDNLDKPYALYAGPLTVGAIIVGWFFIAFFKAIASWCQAAGKAFLAWRKQDGSTFWLVIVTFLAVSVLESGSFFNILLGPLSVYETLGYAAALVIDLVAVECMRARLAAVRMRDANGARLYLFGVVACATLSAFANVYSSLLHFQDPVNTLIPWVMIKAAPWIGMAFPLLIVFLSFAADYTADQTSTRLDPEEYEKSEKKRIRLLEIQRDQLRQRVSIEQELDTLNAKLGHKKERRTFFLVHLLFPKDGINAQAVMDQTMEAIKPQFETLAKQNEELNQRLLSFVQNAQNAYAQLAMLVENQARQVKDIDAQKDADNALMMEQIRLSQEEVLQALKGQINDAISSTLTLEKETIQQVVKEALMSQDNQTDKASVSSAQTPTYPTSYEEDKSEDMATDNQQEDSELAFVLANYPIVKRWLSESQKSLTLEEVEIGTGHSRKMVLNRHRDKTLARTKNPLKVTTMSVVEWLKTAPLPKSKTASKEESNQPDNNEVMGADMVPETPGISDPDTGEFEAIMKGHNQADNLDELEEMTA